MTGRPHGRTATVEQSRPCGAGGRPGTCLVMGVLNVTPDSFSDGGAFADREAALEHGLAMHAAGATYVDVGGESTRPGALRVDAAEERRRVVPVVRELVRCGVSVSIDTTRASVAEAALAAGAALVNDVSGGLADPAMADVVADAGARWVLMHWRGPSRQMYAAATYSDVVEDVRDELIVRVDAALAAGVDAERLVLDPGLGFAKLPQHDWALLAGLDRLVALGLPVLVGASRKSFLGRMLADADGTPRPVKERDVATAAVSLWAAQAGAWGVRVHDVRSSLDVMATQTALRTAREDAVASPCQERRDPRGPVEK